MDIHLSDDSVLRVLRSVIAHELGRSRRIDTIHLDSVHWQASTSLTAVAASASDSVPQSLEVDSLELISLATAVTQLFQVHRSGLEDYLLRYRTLGQWVEVVQTSRGRGETALGFQTSGSTGTPKLIVHPWQTLESEVEFFAQLFADHIQAQPGRLLVPVPCHHIYGFLFGAILAERLCLPVLSGPQAMAVMMRGGFEAGDIVVGHPFFWQQVVRTGLPLASGVLGLTSTGPSEAGVWERLASLGLERMLEIYGSTETAGIGWRDSHAEAFTLLPRWQRAENADTLVECVGGNLYKLPDETHWPGPRHLLPTGRRDSAVQVGGVNVYPERIAWHLRQLDFVADATVALDSTHGGRLRAVIVPVTQAPSPERMTDSLRQWCTRHLSSPERPASFSFSHPG